jgi:hypothetical protein
MKILPFLFSFSFCVLYVSSTTVYHAKDLSLFTKARPHVIYTLPVYKDQLSSRYTCITREQTLLCVPRSYLPTLRTLGGDGSGLYYGGHYFLFTPPATETETSAVPWYSYDLATNTERHHSALKVLSDDNKTTSVIDSGPSFLGIRRRSPVQMAFGFWAELGRRVLVVAGLAATGVAAWWWAFGRRRRVVLVY